MQGSLHSFQQKLVQEVSFTCGSHYTSQSVFRMRMTRVRDLERRFLGRRQLGASGKRVSRTNNLKSQRDSGISEDVIARLKAAEEEAAMLRKQLAAVQVEGGGGYTFIRWGLGFH